MHLIDQDQQIAFPGVSLGLYGGSRTQDGGNSGCISREWDTTRRRKRGLRGRIMKLRI
jgi:hypothetical protein